MTNDAARLGVAVGVAAVSMPGADVSLLLSLFATSYGVRGLYVAERHSRRPGECLSLVAVGLSIVANVLYILTNMQ